MDTGATCTLGWVLISAGGVCCAQAYGVTKSPKSNPSVSKVTGHFLAAT
jgi:hypothetical protein